MILEKNYTVQEVADICRVTPETVRLWLRRGFLEGTRGNHRSWLIPESKLQKYLEEHYG